MDNANNRGAADRARINVHQEHEVKYWTKELGLTREELEDVVRRVGVMAEDVRESLRKKS